MNQIELEQAVKILDKRMGLLELALPDILKFTNDLKELSEKNLQASHTLTEMMVRIFLSKGGHS